MTATTAAPPRTAARVRDSRTFRRLALAAMLPLGPLTITVLRGVLPYTSDTSTDIVSAVAADPGAQALVVWMTFLALFTLPPAVIALARLSARRAPVLGTLALVVAGAGYLSLFWWTASDTVALTAVRGGVDAAVIVRVLDLYVAHPTVAISLGVFVVGHVVGTILLGLALWRARMMPAWAGIVLAVSQPVHLFSVIIGKPAAGHPCLGATTCMFAVAAVAAVALARMPDDDFDLPPQR